MTKNPNNKTTAAKIFPFAGNFNVTAVRCALATSLLLFLPVGCSNEPSATAPLVVENARMRVPLESNRMSAAYATIVNASDEELTIVAATSASIEAIEFHETLTTDGIAKMVKLDDPVIAATESLVLQPGGKHLMLFGVKDMELAAHVIEFHLDNGRSTSHEFHVKEDILR